MENPSLEVPGRASSPSHGEDEETLKLAEIAKLPTYIRLRTGLLKSIVEDDDENGEAKQTVLKKIDVNHMDSGDRQLFIDRNFKVAERDNEKFLRKLRDRLDNVGIQLPTVEVRFENLQVEARCHVGARALPTLANTLRNIMESGLGLCGINFAKRINYTILKDITGIIKSSRMTLLLGPPSSGKTTLLLALAGKLDPNLKVQGQVTYNGHRLEEIVPQKTSAYISQNDVHLGDLTVKETLDYSARFQGVGSRFDLLKELVKREKEVGIYPEPDVDLFMKATAVEGAESNLITAYILKLLGLDICKDTVVGDEMRQGISGGQRKRVTTGEMIVGPAKTLFMDEISTGLDSATTYQIVKCMQQIAHFTEATILMSLLQPDPETFDLFDNIILLSEGQIVYQGPREHVLDFFESFGFKCPERKGIADFLQEVTSKKDQKQYWADRTRPYKYISVSEFATSFNSFHVGQQLRNELLTPYDKTMNHKAALVCTKNTVPTMQILKASMDRQKLLIKRTAFVYIVKIVQIFVVAIITSTVFSRTTLGVTYDDGALYIGAMIFAINVNMFTGFAELAITIARLPVFYKHRDLLFYPAWTFTIPNFLLDLPMTVFNSTVWTVVTYFIIGYAPEAGSFFKHLLVIFLVQQMASGLFRLLAAVCRSMIIANTGVGVSLLILFLVGGLILPKGQIPVWISWLRWISPLTYAFNALTTNEMLSPRWMNKVAPDRVTGLGVAVLQQFDVDPKKNWFWIGATALLGFTILYNVLFTFSLVYLNPIGKPQAFISEDVAKSGNNDGEMTLPEDGSQSNTGNISNEPEDAAAPKRGMILPFIPFSMSFDSVNYYVDMPKEIKDKGATDDRLQLLHEVTGAFVPGALTALMGVSGAGKTTLMDVLAGRKTGGYIEGDIRISGFPKRQETFARISGYCEQTDIHSPQVTIRESLIYSAFLRLPKEVSSKEKLVFVDEVMELVELNNLKDAIVGLPGISGLSTEQRKRLTIAVELVANPSIIFMDEPTSGLDARAAAIVMRTVRNTVDTGRTVVCTIHQPSIDIFEAFDELLLMKRGGHVIYSGPLGRNSHKLIEYFEAIPEVPKIKTKQNPAAWMLEASSAATEGRLGIDFADHYKSSSLYQQTKALVKDLGTPQEGKTDLSFPTQYSQSTWEQFKSCLWKQWWTYWRSPSYNLVRYVFTFAISLILGTIFWQVGTTRENSHDLTTIIGAMFLAVLFVGINNCSTVQPVVAVERTVFYRERAAGMYSALPYALAQVIIEIPFIFFQATYYSLTVYAMMSFEWNEAKFMWFFFISFISFLYFTYYGMMVVSITPNQQVAAIFASTFYSLFSLFSGFFIPKPVIPKWWTWYYYICPVAWTVYGLIVTQYGDVEDTIKVPGISPDPSIKWYVENHFGYDLNFMWPTAAILVAFAIFFASIFAICIKKLNFQHR